MTILRPAPLAGAIAITILAAAATPAQVAQRETRERTVVVSVVGSDDAPLAGLTLKDFVVREDGLAREVTRVEPAPPPSHVALLIDDSQAARDTSTFLRPALAAFVHRVAAAEPPPQMALWTFGERPTRRVDFTPIVDDVGRATQRLFPINSAGAYFLEAILEIVRSPRLREARDPVLVAFVSENGPEFSNVLEKQVADALRRAGASLWSVALQTGPQPLGSTEVRERARVLSDVTVQSGGVNLVVMTPQAIEHMFGRIGAELTSRYAVTYGRPDALVPPDKIEVDVPRSGVRVRASRWTGQ